MKEDYQQTAAKFAKSVINQDFQAAHKFLAPWLQEETATDNLQN